MILTELTKPKPCVCFTQDDELGERSREILGLESELRDQKRDISTLTQNNTLLLNEHKDMERKYIEGQVSIIVICY